MLNTPAEPAVSDRAGAGLPRWVEVPSAALGLLACLPLLLLAGAAIKLSSKGAVLFRQARAGRRGRPFVLYKLRTMRAGAGGPLVTAAGDPRITKVGRLLRASKLDELPELWNVIRGDMSLVGPRPEVPELVDLSDPLWQQVLRQRPGITDPVSIRLRHEEALLDRVAGDRERYYRETLQPLKLRGYIRYRRERSWRRDLQVLLQTLLELLRSPRSAAAQPSDSQTERER